MKPHGSRRHNRRHFDVEARNIAPLSPTGAALALLSLVADAAGCVERRMTVRSNPPGAAVYVDDYQIGTTPVAVNYTYYGTRKIRLVKDGFETLTVYQPMPAPWYQYFGIDFFSENIWPGKIRDERSYDYQMSPIVMVPNDQLLNRAEQLRSNGRAIPAAAVEPIVTGPATGVPPIETLPAPGTMPPADSLPPPGTYPQPSTISPPINSAPINSAPLLPPSGMYTPPGTAPSYAPPGSSVYPPPGAQFLRHQATCADLFAASGLRARILVAGRVWRRWFDSSEYCAAAGIS